MKVRESGMPAVAQWEAFFDPPAILARLGLATVSGDIVEFGSGYGTFTLDAAAGASGTVHALDIDPAMLATVARRAAARELDNVELVERDFMEHGTGLPNESAAAAMLFNILHAANPVALLREARRTVRVGGSIAVIHWNFDPSTPRGPPLAIRPLPEHVAGWAATAGLECGPKVDLPPYHYGFVLRRPESGS